MPICECSSQLSVTLYHTVISTIASGITLPHRGKIYKKRCENLPHSGESDIVAKVNDGRWYNHNIVATVTTSLSRQKLQHRRRQKLQHRDDRCDITKLQHRDERCDITQLQHRDERCDITQLQHRGDGDESSGDRHKGDLEVASCVAVVVVAQRDHVRRRRLQ